MILTNLILTLLSAPTFTPTNTAFATFKMQGLSTTNQHILWQATNLPPGEWYEVVKFNPTNQVQTMTIEIYPSTNGFFRIERLP